MFDAESLAQEVIRVNCVGPSTWRPRYLWLKDCCYQIKLGQFLFRYLVFCCIDVHTIWRILCTRGWMSSVHSLGNTFCADCHDEKSKPSQLCDAVWGFRRAKQNLSCSRLVSVKKFFMFKNNLPISFTVANDLQLSTAMIVPFFQQGYWWHSYGSHYCAWSFLGEGSCPCAWSWENVRSVFILLFWFVPGHRGSYCRRSQRDTVFAWCRNYPSRPEGEIWPASRFLSIYVHQLDTWRLGRPTTWDFLKSLRRLLFWNSLLCSLCALGRVIRCFLWNMAAWESSVRLKWSLFTRLQYYQGEFPTSGRENFPSSCAIQVACLLFVFWTNLNPGTYNSAHLCYLIQ